MVPEELERIRSEVADRYAIGRELARGGTAVVFLAEDLKHRRTVALKVLRPELAASVMIQRFMREIDVAAELRHPHVLPLLDSGVVNGLPFYVMPLIGGGSLRERLAREGALPLDVVRTITHEVAEALDYAHKQEIAHRDIKPENVLFDGGHAVVADFGIARAFTAARGPRLTESGVVVGTPAYMSPEQAGNESQLDGRTDVYALGCVVFEMLAGEPPFTGASAKNVLAKHMHERVPSITVIRPTLPVEVQKVLECALAKFPADRYATAGDFAQALDAAATGVSAVRRGRMRAAAIAGLSLVVVAGTGLGVHKYRSYAEASAPTRDARRLAVLYFDDVSPDRSLGRVADGLTEDLIDQLSQVRALHVTSPNGVRPLRGKSPPMDSVARALGVGAVVGGTVGKTGDSLRVSVRLIDPATGRQLYGLTAMRPLSDVVAVQAKLADSIAFFLRERLGWEFELRQFRTATSAEAWEAVQQSGDFTQRGVEMVRRKDPRAEAEFLRADSLLARAERLDPAWPVPSVRRGRIALAMAQVAGPGVADGRVRPEFSVPWMMRAIAFADSALRRTPNYPEALALRGDARFRIIQFSSSTRSDTLMPTIERDLRAALEARPDLGPAWATLANLYFREGRYEDAAVAGQAAFDADPFLSNVRAVVGWLFFATLNTERYDEAANWCRWGRAHYADDPRFMDCELTLLGWSAKEPRDAAAAWRALDAIQRADTSRLLDDEWGYQRLMVAAAIARGGLRDSAAAVLTRAKAQGAAHPDVNQNPVAEAYVRLLLGQTEETLRLLRSFLQAHPEARGQVARQPWFRSLRTDPRFRALVELPG